MKRMSQFCGVLLMLALLFAGVTTAWADPASEAPVDDPSSSAASSEVSSTQPPPSSAPVTVDKSLLNQKIAEAAGIQKGNYTDATWQDFQTALSSARTVSASADVSQENVNAALQALTNAISNLKEKPVTVNKTELQRALNDAAGYTKYEYTPSSWQALDQAVAAGQVLLSNVNATQAQVDAAAAKIRSAIRALQIAQPSETPSQAPSRAPSSSTSVNSSPVQSLLPPNSNNSDPDANSSQDWTGILSAINSTASGENPSDVVFGDTSKGAGNIFSGESDQSDSLWVLIVGILLIALALGGIGTVVYMQFFSKPKQALYEGYDPADALLEGEEDSVDISSGRIPESSDDGEDYADPDDEIEDRPAPPHPTEQDGSGKQDDDFWDKFFNQ